MNKMKNKLIISILFFAVVFTACEKDDLMPELSATINPAHVVNTIQDTLVVYKGQEIEFVLSGDSDLLTFFSGEGGHVYANRNRIVAPGTPKMDFFYTPNRVTIDHKVEVFASADFKGVYDSISIKNAKWDDLTPPDLKAYLNNSTSKAISTISLANYSGGKPVFIAFRLVINSAARFSNPTFSNLLIRNYQDDGSVSAVVDGFPAAGMAYVTLSENKKWKATGSGNSSWKLSSSSVTVNTAAFDPPAVNPIYNSADGRLHEMWAISKVLYLDKTMPDSGVTIKNIQIAISNYKYTYTKAGIYNVTFVAANTGSTGIKETNVKNLILKVIDKQ